MLPGSNNRAERLSKKSNDSEVLLQQNQIFFFFLIQMIFKYFLPKY